MRIDKRLNFVVQVERADGTTVYVHAAPIGRETFARYHREIAKTFAEIYGGGYGAVAGPRIAGMLLRDVAEAMRTWDGPEGVEAGLFGEIRRLANVVAPNGKGWGTIPLDDAVREKLISEEDASEVENVLSFFIVASAMHLRSELPDILEATSRLWGAQVSSSTSTEFAASLSTSTGVASSGETAAASSVPS